jgi:uncharacterized membrane protein
MTKLAVPVAVMAVLALVIVLGMQLPDPVASHFGVSGAPDSYMSRRALLALMAILVAVVPLLIWLGAGWAAASGNANIPNAAFWLAPERQAETGEYLVGYAALVAVVTAAFMGYTFLLLWLANTQGAAAAHLHMPLFLAGLAAYMLFTTGSLVVLVLRFRLP